MNSGDCSLQYHGKVCDISYYIDMALYGGFHKWWYPKIDGF